ncbi:hypothetical protein CC85DRAFT_312724 [Cutaneotrichosporon oleaginosum]|uniref:SAC3/GANP/THP3 conserved domain-containing protein n=1 Tax=Cutaneotrichosporon oleaginosum TaxID=879819 RepID=A0A0J0XK89_9TREE|nr:uncharacterized protein CC85DRAFT_312724 [Cutaneotrichosporon oleaginosum]KLT41487.1 hypothetical protein CC85DRAFT_312724 [Cutaneotrichosporon oleaginosum]TXT05863.1 hypothetical protein COLE_07183 [Cutaneotrichosporon oleaginosum]
MAPAAVSGADPGDDDSLTRQVKLAARAARFNQQLEGNRYKELEEARVREREAFIQQGKITSGQTDLTGAVDLRGTCEDMCSLYEREFREYTREIHPFEATPQRRIDHSKAVAAYTRSDAGAGHGTATILPSDLRTPSALVRSLDYLVDEIMSQQPPPNPNAVNPPAPTPRRALGYSSGFIRDRTRAIRKEFSLQSSWGHVEAIATFERIARWHILCLRELQEETGTNTDMHIDNAELGRCFTSLRQQYNDRREETGLDMPCANEPEFRAYMLIYDLASKSVSIPISELPQVILDHPLVQLAWKIRQAAQRNFDSQKEGSKLNAELGANLITRYIRLIKQDHVPYLMSCLAEVRLRDMRRSAIRALVRTYPGLKNDEPIRRDQSGAILERKMVLMPTLDRLLGAEEQETLETAWDDIEPVSRHPDDEAIAVVQRFNIRVYQEMGDPRPMGALINLRSPYNDNKDAPFTRRWKLISDKQPSSYAEVVNGRAGVGISGGPAAQPASVAPPPPPQLHTQQRATIKSAPTPNGAAWPTTSVTPPVPTGPTESASAFGTGRSAFGTTPASAFGPSASSFSAFGPSAGSASAFGPAKSAFGTQTSVPSTSAFGAAKSAASSSNAPAPAIDFKPKPSSLQATAPAFEPSKREETKPAAPAASVLSTVKAVPECFKPVAPSDPAAAPTTAPAPKPDFFAKTDNEGTEPKPTAPLFSKPSFFDTTPRPTPPPESGPSKAAMPTFFSSSTAPVTGTVFSSTLPSPRLTSPPDVTPTRTPPEPAIPSIQVTRAFMRKLPSILRDELISEVVKELINDNEAALLELVNEHEAAAERQRSKLERAGLVKQRARQVYDQLLAEHVQCELFAEWFYDMRAQVFAFAIARKWLAWTRRRAEIRASAARQREQDRHQLKSIGLARSHSYVDCATHATSRSRSVRSGAPSLITLPEQVDVSQNKFHKLQEMRRKFFDSDSSLFKTIAGHVAPLIQPAPNEDTLWETVLLTAGQSGSPAGESASAWLTSKLMTPRRGSRVHDGVYYQADVGFRSCATDVRGYFPGSSNTGLYVFEAPLITLNTAARSRNIDDAGDRIEAASSAIQQGSRYRAGLIILTWEPETLEEVVQRLGIEHDIEPFEHVAAVSIHNPETFGALFAAALRTVVPSDPRKSQVVVPLQRVADRTAQAYQELLHVAENLFREFPTESRLVATTLKAACDLLSSLPNAIQDQLDGFGEADESTYVPFDFPPYTPPADTSAAGVAESLQTYMAQPELGAGVAIVSAKLRDAVAHSQPLPLREAFDALGTYVADSVRYATLGLKQWYDPPHHLHAAQRVEASIMEDVQAAAEAAVHALAQEGLWERARATALPPSPPLTPSTATSGIKRAREEDAYDPVKAKAARLAALIAGAKQGLKASQAVVGAAENGKKWRFY